MSLHHTSDAVCPLCVDKLKQAAQFMRDWFLNQVKPKHPDCHVAWAYRDRVDQDKALTDGKSKLPYPRSKHNKTNKLTKEPEAEALDLFQIDRLGKAVFDPMFYAGVNEMNQKAKDPIRWGGTFKSLGDHDHFEMELPPETV